MAVRQERGRAWSDAAAAVSDARRMVVAEPRLQGSEIRFALAHERRDPAVIVDRVAPSDQLILCTLPHDDLATSVSDLAQVGALRFGVVARVARAERGLVFVSNPVQWISRSGQGLLVEK